MFEGPVGGTSEATRSAMLESELLAEFNGAEGGASGRSTRSGSTALPKARPSHGHRAAQLALDGAGATDASVQELRDGWPVGMSTTTTAAKDSLKAVYPLRRYTLLADEPMVPLRVAAAMDAPSAPTQEPGADDD